MTDEEIIRSEAKRSIDRWPAFRDKYAGYLDYIEYIKDEIKRYHKPSYKAIFLDEVLTLFKQGLAHHVSFCEKPKPCATESSFERIIFYVQQEVDELPKIIHENAVQNAERTTVFISYNHQDKPWLDVIRRHFKPLEKRIDFWDDSRIKPGQRWEDEIKNAIARAKVALLLVSADFFNSEFITKQEIPPLLEAADKDGATILFLVLKPCLLEEYPQILQYQGLNAPSKPFIGMSELEQEELCVNLVKQVRDTLAS